MLPAVFIDAEVFIWNNGTFESINLSTAFTIALSHVQQIKLPSSPFNPPGNIVGVRSTSHNSNLLKNASQWFQMNFNCSAFVLISLNSLFRNSPSLGSCVKFSPSFWIACVQMAMLVNMKIQRWQKGDVEKIAPQIYDPLFSHSVILAPVVSAIHHN